MSSSSVARLNQTLVGNSEGEERNLLYISPPDGFCAFDPIVRETIGSSQDYEV
jgi:hypothetical protein